MKNNELDINTLLSLSMVMGTDAIEFQEKLGQQNLCNSCELPIKCNEYGYFKKLHDMGIVILESEEKIRTLPKGELFMKVELPKGWKIKPTDHSMWSNLVDDKGRERASIFYKAAFYDRDAHLNFNRRFRISGKIADYDEEKFRYKLEYIETGEYKTVWVDDKGKECREDNMAEMIYYDYDNEGKYIYDKSFRQIKKPIYKKNPDYIKLTGYEKYSQPFHYEVYDCDGTILFKSDIVKTDFEYSNNEHWKFFDHLDEIEKKAKGQCLEWLNNNYPDWENDLAYWD